MQRSSHLTIQETRCISTKRLAVSVVEIFNDFTQNVNTLRGTNAEWLALKPVANTAP